MSAKCIVLFSLEISINSIANRLLPSVRRRLPNLGLGRPRTP